MILVTLVHHERAAVRHPWAMEAVDPARNCLPVHNLDVP